MARIISYLIEEIHISTCPTGIPGDDKVGNHSETDEISFQTRSRLENESEICFCPRY